jgi:thioredoxin reductase
VKDDRARRPRLQFDVVIIGAGPAGLSAALVLGRCLRRVLVIDGGPGRNRASRSLNGYLTRDGVTPARFQELARAEAVEYGVVLRRGLAVGAERVNGGFRVKLKSGAVVTGRKLLLATGVTDRLPEWPGFAALYGTSVHHCPYCDAWGHRGKPMAAYGKGRAALGLALSLRTWTQDVTACTDGRRLSAADAATARENDIAVRTERVARLEGKGGWLRRVHFVSGEPLGCAALFFNTGHAQRSDLPGLLGCAFKANGGVRTNGRQCTGVPGLYLAGDAHKEVQFVISAAAEGAIAAVAINGELQQADVRARASGRASRR